MVNYRWENNRRVNILKDTKTHAEGSTGTLRIDSADCGDMWLLVALLGGGKLVEALPVLKRRKYMIPSIEVIASQAQP
jgi:hypothetical protein